MTHLRPIVLGSFALGLAAARSPAAVIYQAREVRPSAALIIAELDESSSSAEITTGPVARENEQRVGDSITFAGADRFVTRFDTRMMAFGGVAAGLALDVELSIYTNVAGLPGPLLWSGVAPGVAIPITSGIASIDASFAPNLTLPDSVCFGIAFTGIARAPSESRTFGVSTSSLASIGSSPNTILRQRSADGVWFSDDLSFTAGGIFRHVEARVEAVPAPHAAAIAAILFALWTRRRR